jgi:hypothetical protein
MSPAEGPPTPALDGAGRATELALAGHATMPGHGRSS